MAIRNKNNLKNRIKRIIKKYGPAWFLIFLRQIRYIFQNINCFWYTIWRKSIGNYINLKKNERKIYRCLEIGSGNKRIPGFETLDILGGQNIDYVFDAAKQLPFKNGVFDLIYSSHILEHIPWYQTERVLKEWMRILKNKGQLEIYVPNGLKICDALLRAEEGVNMISKDGWCKFNPREDPYIWVAGRIFTYGDGTGNPNHPNWHRAIFTPKYLKELFERVGLVNIKEIDHSEVRGYDHGWINFGLKGIKP